MSVFGGNPLLLTSAAGGAYEIQRSLRFNSADSAYLNRTPASAGNRKTWTWAGWVKRSTLGVNSYIFTTTFSNANSAGYLYFSSNNYLYYWDRRASTDNIILETNAIFRDVSAWYHIVLSVNYSASTAANRAKLYVNGVEQTYSTANYPGTTEDSYFNTATTHYVSATGGFINGYLADVYFIDGQALTPSSFTTTDLTTGQLIPKAYTGSYGTNGFKLNFSDNSTTAALGTDTSGNGNTWTVNNLTAAEYRVIDAPSLSNGAMIARGASGGSVTVTISGTGNKNYFTSTNGINWTWQSTAASATYTANYIAAGGAGTNSRIAVSAGVFQYAMWNTNTNFDSTSNTTTDATGLTFTTTTNNGANGDSLVDTPTSYGTDTGVGGEVRGNYATLNPLQKGSDLTLSNGNLDLAKSSTVDNCTASTIGMTSGKWYFELTITNLGSGEYAIGFGKNIPIQSYMGSNATTWSYADTGSLATNGSSTSYGSSYTTGDILGAAFDGDNGTLTFYKNGTSQGTAATGLTQGPYFFAAGAYNSAATRSANFGQRAFAYPVSGYKALCDTNLPTPTVAQGNTLMDATLWTGNGTSQTITLPGGFSPDLVWIKQRNGTEFHALFNTIVGATTRLFSNSTSAEATNAQTLTAFNSNGFSVGNTNEVNGSSNTYVAWSWDAGSSTVSNTAGSVTSQVRANPSAGFSVVSWTAGTAPVTIGHGLGVAPQFIIMKSRTSSAVGWQIGHVSLGWTARLFFDTAAADITTGAWNDTSPTSTLFTVGSTGYQTGNMIAYCWTPVVGYSNAFTYTGNGSSDGPFCFLGFRPRFLIIKRTDAAYGWYMYDTARDTYNIAGKELLANASDAEVSDSDLDILSNGFKPRRSSLAFNASGGTFIGFAWAESPFQYARAR